MKYGLLATLFVISCGIGGTTTAQVSTDRPGGRPTPGPVSHPVEGVMKRAGSTSIDLRALPRTKPVKRERPEREPPEIIPIELPGSIPPSAAATAPSAPTVAAPVPLTSVLGLDFNTWGAGHPPDTNGDVGPTYFIETVNTAVGVYNKTTGAQVAAFTFDTLMSQGSFGNLCDTDNFGDPVVVYDTFEDRWVITDFAFQLDGANNVVNPPGSFQCFAVSKTGDPVSGGWNFYSINTAGGLGDYPKFGVWPDGLYMSVNMFDYAASGTFQGVRLYAFNKAQMYAGAPSVQSVSFNAPAGEFTMLPANARLQTGTPPAGAPNYFSVVWQFLNAVSVYKFHVDWNSISTSALTGPFIALTATNWSQFSGAGGLVPSPANSLDTLYPRLMVQNQYSNIGGVESLWDSHTVGASGTTSAQAAVRYYQVKVSGGTVESNATQAFTWSPDTTVHRFMPSVAVDRAGNMALGYSASSGSLFPAIRYAGRLSTDAANTISQTETSLIEGAGSQTVTTRWGDYSSMSLDPDGCRFWLSNEYYNAPNSGNWQTRIGSFKYPGAACTTVGSGSVQGTVTATAGGTPIAGATVALGSRTTTTNGSGAYSFAGIPSGTYPGMAASATGFNPATASAIVVTDGGTTVQDFSLTDAPDNACPVDTTQGDFQLGIPTTLDLVASPGNVILASGIDQQNTSVMNSGFGFDSHNWFGQTFTAGASGPLTQVDVDLFCSGCTGTTPNITVSIRNTSNNRPTGADLATATIPGFSSGAGGFFSAVFAAPVTLTSGTQYAIVVRPVSDPSAGTYAYVISSGSPYAGGRWVTSSNSGTTWVGQTADIGFKTYVTPNYQPTGDFISALKDSNPPTGEVPSWSALTWTASAPANTLLRFQVAGSTSMFGPFNFIGPDGTAATFYTTSGGSLSQFDGYRYLRYRGYFSSTNNAATPTLNDATVCYTALAPPDLSISNSDGVTTGIPGGSVAYSITASNSGPSAAIGATVSDSFPASLTCTWTCGGSGGGKCTASGSGNINDSVNLPNGGSVTYTATCSIAASATGSLSNTATVTEPAGLTDPATGNNSATDTDTLTPQANLGITNSDGVTTATPGNSVSYTITASNPGLSNAPGSTVADTFPAALTCSWTCAGSGGGTCSASGAGNINESVNLPSGGSVTYSASCSIAASATGTLSNTATVTAPGSVTDPTPGNNSATDTDTLAPSANLAITNTDGVTTATPGNSVSYTITASNAGPSNAPGSTVADTFPAALTCTWTCSGSGGGTCTASGSGNINDPVNLPGGGSVVYNASCSIAASATGSLSNTATVATAAGVTDPASANNSATDTDSLTPKANLGITNSDGVTTAIPGNSVSYTITASNTGPSNAPGSTVADTFPAALTCTWTCSGSGGGTCTASGSGNINDSANLPNGGSVTYTATCSIAASATGSLSNTATVSIGAGVTDPTPGNNSATDTDTLTPQANLGITKTDGVTTATPGNSVSYTITASNAGPSNAPGSTVADTFPATLTCTWTCLGSGGGTCTASSSGNVNDSVNLPSGGSVTYSATCSIAASATGSLINTATVSTGAGVTDPASGNNSATDTDTLAPSANLAITNSDGVTTAAPGGQVIYTITASNPGPSNAPASTVADTFPASLTCSWTCGGAGSGSCTASGSGNINDSVNLPSGGSVTYTATCSIDAAAVGSLSNTATVAAPAGVTDPTPGNNSATDTDTLAPGANLGITNTDGVTTATPGGSVSYTITASNAGPSSAPGSTVADTFPASLNCTWTCNGSGGGTCTASGSGNINDSADLPNGGSVVYNATCSIAAAATGSLSNTAAVTPAASVADPAPGNNSATDTDTLVVQADVALTLTDNRGFVQVGDVLDYIIEVTNPTGPSTAVATVTDVLPAQLGSGSWVCSGTGSATCNDGSGNTLNDTATLPVGGKAAYTYSATLQSAGAADSLVNSASVSLTSGTDGTPGNNSQTDTDVVVIYKDGFEGDQALLAAVNAAGTDYVTAQLSVDAALLNRLSIIPVPVATGRSADGRKLFTLELARFGRGIALRTLTTDAHGATEISPWQNVDLRRHLLEFAWQSASARGNDGYFAVGDGGSPILIDQRSVPDRLTRLLITVENSVPWLIVIEHP